MTNDLWKADRERFQADTKHHEMTVLHDDGLYRHIRFQAPQTGIGWYSLITSPGQLTFLGDMGCYVFCRITEMFDFFHLTSTGINPGYWGEKLQAHSGYREYSEDRFRRLVREHYDESIDTMSDPKDVWEAIEKSVLDDDSAACEETARLALDNFEHPGFLLDDTWGWDIRDYTVQYLWACHAIQSGIEQYKAVQS